MQNGFTSYLLSYDGSGTPALVEHTHPLHLNKPFNLDTADDKIFLASGFSALYDDTTLPLSTTLQLNGDLGDFSLDQLGMIGRAELERSTGTQYRSMIREANPKVVALGKSADELDRFINTYGGVLEITGLLSQGMHPEFTTATELDIQEKKDRVRLDFLVRTPVNHARCTYCGNCGPVCPEQCIDEHLFLDLDRCTFCKACLTACAADAVDLHGAQRRSIETPALLLLTTDAEPAGSSDLIFGKEDLPDLFASIFAARIDETVLCNNQLCQYSGQYALGCDLCIQTCRHNAIQQNSTGTRVDQQRCLECGACIAICPTGAMESFRFTDRNFIPYWKNIPFEPGCSVVIGSEQLLHTFWWRNRNQTFTRTFFLEHPVPTALTTMSFLFLLSAGAGQVLLLAEDDKEQVPTRQMEQANVLYAELFSVPDPIKRVETGALAPLLQQEFESPLTSFYKDFSFTNRREKLISILDFFLMQAPGPHRFSHELFSDFGRVNCDKSLCTQCLACVGVCRTEALNADSDNFALVHSPARCIQCGLCAAICPEQALTMDPGLILDEDFFGQEILARAEPVKCLECGKVFGTRESLTRVMAVLTEKNLMDREDTLLNYCETCRVVHLFEEQDT